MRFSYLIALTIFVTNLSLLSISSSARADSVASNPIVFVTMVPNPSDFGTLAATFGNHLTAPNVAFRGGDLWIRYPNGNLKNLTSAAGYGNAGMQESTAIAVRDPSVHWDGSKVIFSMVIGAPTQRYQVINVRWQLYEISNLGESQTPVITKVPNQPSAYNNISPTYASDDQIIFVTDRPRDDSVLHTYPQRDEYESAAVNSGLWKLNPANGALKLLDHAPSGDFNPSVDSFGRVIFTRWDHLQRDQQNLIDSYGAFNFASETSSTALPSAPEVFPEPRSAIDPDYRSTMNLFTINQFFPWMMNQDGTEMETLNHIGRQEIGLYSERNFNNDPNVQEFYGQYSTGTNQNDFTIMLHIKEQPTSPGTYVGTSCQEFGTHSSGQIISLSGAPGVNPDTMNVSYLTHPDTAAATASPGPNHSGLYRDPLPLTNGNLLASHTSNTREDSNIGSSSNPQSRYDLRIKQLTLSGSYYQPSTLLTSGITKTISFWNPDALVSYSGTLWEMMPVELVARSRPTGFVSESTLQTPEATILAEAGVSESALRDYLRSQNLALIVSRNVTMRDRNDRQQPTNLRVHNTTTQSLPRSGTIYDISHLDIFQGDLIRGYSGGSNGTGRRVLAQPMHSVLDGVNLPTTTAHAIAVASDGSVAAFVPARRALTWQLSDPNGDAVVRERYWLTFQPGEIRVCASCHGINTGDHLGRPNPTNPPLALAQLLAHWQNLPMPTPSPTPPGGTPAITLRGHPSGVSVAAGKRFSVTASGLTRSRVYRLAIRLNNVACAGNTRFGGAQNSRRLIGKFPAALRGVTVRFHLLRDGNSTALHSAQRTLPGQPRASAITGARLRTGCRSIRNSLR